MCGIAGCMLNPSAVMEAVSCAASFQATATTPTNRKIFPTFFRSHSLLPIILAAKSTTWAPLSRKRDTSRELAEPRKSIRKGCQSMRYPYLCG